MTLHLLIHDKFTEPFYKYVNDTLKLKDQQFVFISDKPFADSAPNLFKLKSPLRKNIFHNFKQLWKLCRNADRIILHGDTLMPFFALFPSFLNKAGWIIYGQELYSLSKESGNQERIKKFVLSKVKYHITHIKGDSDLANQLLHSKAQFVYSPMYLSNVADTSNFNPVSVSAKSKLKIMVGNSTDPTNNHKAVFRRIEKYIDDVETVFCPLSYGMYDDYKQEIMTLGKETFGDKFVALDQFMPFETYKKFLADIDIVIFDHYRQEAMGVTLTLLSLGKIVYVNPDTTSFESLTRRGFQIFDNNLIESDGLKADRDVTNNKTCLQKHYSQSVFNESWNLISQL